MNTQLFKTSSFHKKNTTLRNFLPVSNHYLKKHQLIKIKENDYQINLGNIKIFSHTKWNITYNSTLNQKNTFHFFNDKNCIHPNHIAITGNNKNNVIEIRFLPKKLFNASLYQLQKELYNTTINPYLVGDVEYNQDLENIQADNIYRARFSVCDLSKKIRGICWELRSYKDIIQSVFVYNNDSDPPKNNSIIHTIISDIIFNTTSNEQYVYILKRSKKLYKQVEKTIDKNTGNSNFPELIHIHNLILFLNRH